MLRSLRGFRRLPAAGKGRRLQSLVFLILPCLALALSGCAGGGIGPTASTGLEISPATLSFGSVSVGKTVTANISIVNLNSAAVQISAVNVTGAGFTAQVQNSLPITVAAAGGSFTLSVAFDPTVSGTVSGQLTLTTNSATDPTPSVALNGTGLTVIPPLSAFTCSSGTIPELSNDTCTVTLSSAAASGGESVSLSSSSTAISVPASVTVAAGATSANFQATASAVTSTQNVILTASAGGASDTTDIEVELANPSLTLSATGLTFGSVNVNTPVTQTVTVNSTGAAAVTINSVTVSGTGFTVTPPTLPMTLSPGSSTQLTVQFDPSIAGAVAGQLTIGSDSSSSNAVSLSGTGVPVLTGFTCTNASMTGSGTDSCGVTLNAAAATGGFTVNLSSSNSAVSVPSTVTVPAGSSSASFSATVTGVSTTQTSTLSATAGSVTENFSLTLDAVVPTLTGITCTNASLTGSVTDSCSVSLNTAASSAGLSVGLSSNNASVSVPLSVTVSSGATSASFTATATAVSTVQPVTLTATAGTVTKTFALQLNAYVATLSINATSISFGSVALNTPSTQSLSLTSTGTAPVTVSTVTISGTGYSFSGATFPLTLNTTTPSKTLSVEFDPTISGTQSGTLTITSNSSTNPTYTVNLSGTGGAATAYQVNLSWTAPSSSPDPVAGYNIYRSPSGQSSYQLMGSVAASEFAYMDSNNIQDGATYDYIVESVDSSGNESVPSNTASVQIP
jgi:Abnormal spindle-like microcephaly-assoc'd, ASPM-SPD-2-Hydin